jgi:ubiquinone/menaquinone biosynthesis C-methylase UbiE
MTLYDSIGKNYNSTRQSDKRIVNKLISLLNLPIGSTIADIGAGTGNYSNAIAKRWG